MASEPANKIEPPPTRVEQSRKFWTYFAETRKKHPGEWDMAGPFSPAIGTFLRRGEYAAFLPARGTPDPRAYMRKHWAITARSFEGPTQRVMIYISWIGDGCDCGECP